MKPIPVILISALSMTQTFALSLPTQTTKSYDCSVCNALSKEELQDAWKISNKLLDQTPSNWQKSYGFREKISLSQLQQGVAITTLAPGAIIRIDSIQGTPIPSLNIITPNQRVIPLKEASTLYSQDETMGDLRFALKHQTLLQLKPELGSGLFIIKSNHIQKNKSDAFLVHVYDKFSSSYLGIKTNAIHYQSGETLEATIYLDDTLSHCSTDDIKATLVSPRGEMREISLKKTDQNEFTGTLQLTSENNDQGENWYVEVEVNTKIGETSIKRNGHTAFSYAIPSASLTHINLLSIKPLTLQASVSVATSSRYALQAVLYHKNDLGEIKAIETSQKAQWLDAGEQLMQFTFDNSDQFEEDSLYLGYLRLTDYGQLKPVYQFNQPVKLSHLAD